MSRKYYCEDCERSFDAEDAVKDYDRSTGYLAILCPFCDGDSVDDAAECDQCGEIFPEYAVTNGLCENCLGKEAENIRQVIEYGADDPDNGEVTINAFFAWMYTPDEINDILTADFMKLPEEKQKEWAKRYMNNDPWMFADWLKERGQDE